jgi:Holliday junction resolvase
VNTAIKGRHQEHRSRAVLEAAGYTVIRAAASKGDGWDLVGWSAGGWVLCSVKSAEWPAPLARQILAEQVVPPGTRKLIHRWRHRAVLPDVMEL